jgi:hypothetical protein
VASTSGGRRRREGGGADIRFAGLGSGHALPLGSTESVGDRLGCEERGEGTWDICQDRAKSFRRLGGIEFLWHANVRTWYRLDVVESGFSHEVECTILSLKGAGLILVFKSYNRYGGGRGSEIS